MNRDGSLDALRGLAVLGMVFSGSIGFGSDALPGWMYHAQLPPPAHRLVPTLPGISWVDLVFPMFLFALGAAIPLALRDRSLTAVAWVALRRTALLLYFALFTQQFKAASLGGDSGAQALSLLAFVLLGLQLTARVPGWLRAAAWAAGLLLWASVGIDPQRRDIILVVLAVMAGSASLLWAATRGREAWRWWLLPAVVALMLAPADAWTRLLTATPAPWAYQFAFLKYLLVVVPGLTVGDWLARRPAGEPAAVDRGLSLLALALVVVNLSLLYARQTGLNAALSAVLLAAGCWRASRVGDALSARAWPLAAALLLLGLLLEPLQGGIRKDPSTFSYQVVCAGLSLLLLLALRALRGPLLAALLGVGRNPLLGYVAGSLCLLPLLQLSGLHAPWAALNGNAALALGKGLLFTAAVLLLTLVATRRGWTWRA